MSAVRYTGAFVFGFGIVAICCLFLYKCTVPPMLLKDPDTEYSVQLVEKENISANTRRFRFALPSCKHVLGLPVGQHIYLSAKVEGTIVTRPYTPVSSERDYGHFDLVIKVYFKNVHPKFPRGGKMSQYLNNMAIGDSIDIRGPSGRLVYKGKGEFAIKPYNQSSSVVVYQVKKVGMIASGTGVSPMLQLIRCALKDQNDKLEMALLFADQTEEDILLRSELEDMASRHGDRFKLWYTVDRPGDNWKFDAGFISSEMIEDHLPAPAHDTLLVMCGPRPKIKFASILNLDNLGYDSKLIYEY